MIATDGQITVREVMPLAQALARAIAARSMTAAQYAAATATVRTSIVSEAIQLALAVEATEAKAEPATADRVELRDGSVWEVDRATGARTRIVEASR